jgi:hypothetical protein
LWRNQQRGAHDWTVRVLYALLDANVKPVASEFMVWEDDVTDPDAQRRLPQWRWTRRLATAIDLVGVDATTGELHLIELKTGYANGEWHRTRGPMRGALAALQDTPRNRARIQIVLGAMLMTMGHGLQRPFSCWVIRVDDTVVDRQLVKPDFVKQWGKVLWDNTR